MSLDELIPMIRSLDRSEKIRLIRRVAEELDEEETGLLRKDQSYPVWSPFDAHEGADTLLRLLEDDGRSS